VYATCWGGGQKKTSKVLIEKSSKVLIVCNPVGVGQKKSKQACESNPSKENPGEQ
jgi:hypothetical protein